MCLRTAAFGELFFVFSSSPLINEIHSAGVLLDAIDASIDNEICLHRTIAPFQCSILCLSDDHHRDLTHLTKFVELLVKRAGIATFDPPRIVHTKTDRDARIREMDSIGVPYVLLLDETSLADGMLGLRNRDTTLSETIHLSDVPRYLLEIFGISSEEQETQKINC